MGAGPRAGWAGFSGLDDVGTGWGAEGALSELRPQGGDAWPVTFQTLGPT